MSGRETQDVPARIARSAGLTVVAFGLVIILAWLAHAVSARLVPDLPSMKPGTALAFVLAGAGLWSAAAHGRFARRGALSGAGAAAAIAGAGLAQAATGFELGFGDGWAGPVPYITAYGLLVFAAGITAHYMRRAERVFMLCASAGLIAFVFILISRAYGVHWSPGPLFGNIVAVFAAAAFCLLFVGLACLRPHSGWMAILLSPSPAGQLSRRMTPVIVAIPVVGWLRLQGEMAGLFDGPHGLAIFTIVNIVLMSGALWYFGGHAERQERTRRTILKSLEIREAQLTDSETRYRSVVSLLGEGVFLYDGGRCVYCNAHALAMVGLRGRHEIVGEAPDERIRIEDRAKFNQLLWACRTEPQAAIEVRMLTFAGEEILVSVQAGCFVQNGRLQTVVICRDITATRNAELRVREAQKMEAIGQLTGGVAHDFNNLLTVIGSNAEYLAQTPDPGKVRATATAICSATAQGASLVRQLLMFARKQRLQPAVVDVGRQLERMVPLFRRTLEENIDIQLVPDAGLPLVSVDPAGLQSALLNLCLNARDAMPGGGKIAITVKLRAGVPECPSLGPGDYVEIAVSDSGRGMSSEVARHAFEPFFTTKPDGSGTGLGLSGVYGFTKESGGDAVIQSRLNHGTTVFLYLPALAAAVAAEPSATPRPQASASPAGGRVLIVEDNDLLRETLFDQLERLGFTVTAAKSAPEALKTLADAAFDLVISDVIMPGGMNGADLAREIAKRWPATNLLLMSGYTDRSALGRVDMPADVAFMSKPYTAADLETALGRALAKHRAG